MVSSASISQALGNPGHQTIIIKRLFHLSLSQTIMENFNQGEHVIAAFLDVEKRSTMFGTMDSGTRFTSLICPPSFVGGFLIF